MAFFGTKKTVRNNEVSRRVKRVSVKQRSTVKDFTYRL